MNPNYFYLRAFLVDWPLSSDLFIDLSDEVIEMPRINLAASLDFGEPVLPEMEVQIVLRDKAWRVWDHLRNKNVVIWFVFNDIYYFTGIMDKIASSVDLANKVLKIRAIDSWSQKLKSTFENDADTHIQLFDKWLKNWYNNSDLEGFLNQVYKDSMTEIEIQSNQKIYFNGVYIQAQKEWWEKYKNNQSIGESTVLKIKDILHETARSYGLQVFYGVKSDGLKMIVRISDLLIKNIPNIININDYSEVNVNYSRSFKRYVLLPIKKWYTSGVYKSESYVALIDLLEKKEVFRGLAYSSDRYDRELIIDTFPRLPKAVWNEKSGSYVFEGTTGADIRDYDLTLFLSFPPFLFRADDVEYINKIVANFWGYSLQARIFEITLPYIQYILPLDIVYVADIGLGRVESVEHDFERFSTKIMLTEIIQSDLIGGAI